MRSGCGPGSKATSVAWRAVLARCGFGGDVGDDPQAVRASRLGRADFGQSRSNALSVDWYRTRARSESDVKEAAWRPPFRRTTVAPVPPFPCRATSAYRLTLDSGKRRADTDGVSARGLRPRSRSAQAHEPVARCEGHRADGRHPTVSRGSTALVVAARGADRRRLGCPHVVGLDGGGDDAQRLTGQAGRVSADTV